jgi:hypothetical protein
VDGLRFDALTRSLAAGVDRRRLLKGLAAVGLGGAFARFGQGAVDAACPPGQVARRGQCICKATGRPPVGGICPCPNGQTSCANGCTDTARDSANCGGCGTGCPVERPYCDGGICVACKRANDCPPATGPCQRPTCANGVCGVESDPALVGGSCNASDPCVENAVCGADGVCTGAQINCGNCRTCLGGQCLPRPNGTSCLGGTFQCCDGQCIQACGVGLECCGGACHEPCPTFAVRGADCACVCPSELPNLCNPGTLDAYCAAFQTDEANCGACGTTCAPNATCFDGACRCCQGGSVECGGPIFGNRRFITGDICCDSPQFAFMCCNAICDDPQLDCVMFCASCPNNQEAECDLDGLCPEGYRVVMGAAVPFPNGCPG